MIDSNILSVIAFVAIVLGGIGTILGGISIVMHAIAARTKTTVGDKLAADVDAAHAKIDVLISLLRGLGFPSSSSGGTAPASAAAITSPQIPSAKAAQAGSVGAMLIAALAALGIVGATAMLTGCATLRPDAATAIDSFIACEDPTLAKAAADLEPLALAVVSKWIGGSNATLNTAGLKTDLTGIKDHAQQCAITAAADTIALAAISTPAPSDPTAPLQARVVSSSARSATGSSAADNVRAAFTSVRSELGWAPVHLANGRVM